MIKSVPHKQIKNSILKEEEKQEKDPPKNKIKKQVVVESFDDF
jgi:hypothetical protein